MSKTCSKCGATKDIAEFGKYARSKDGHKSACKECLREQGRIYARNRRLVDSDLLNARNKESRKKRLLKNPGYEREYYLKNHDRQIESARKFYRNHRDECLTRQKEWRKNNREIYLQSNRNWRSNNPKRAKELGKITSNMYRARKANAITQNFSYKELDQRMSVFGYKCSYCGGPFEQIDHLIPLSKGGRHCLSNLRPCCKKCNNAKFNKSPAVWFAEIKGKR